MSLESVRQYFKSFGKEDDIQEFSQSSATVELAAQAVGTDPARIAKTLSFYSKEKDHAILIVTAGDMKIDNSKFKHFFGMKAKMLAKEDVEPLTGTCRRRRLPLCQSFSYRSLSGSVFTTV